MAERPGKGDAPSQPDADSRRTGVVPQRLLGVAAALFARQGFERTSVQEIAETAGLTKGAVYHYFDSKDDLLYGIYERVVMVQTERLDRIAAGGGAPAERLRAAAADMVATTVEYLDDSTVFFQSLRHLHPTRRQAVRTMRLRYRETFRSFIVAGQESGALRKDVPPDLALEYFFGAVHYLCHWYRTTDGVTADSLTRHFPDLLLSSLSGPGQSEIPAIDDREGW